MTLERMREVAVARLNTLMHLPPDSPLPPAPVHSIAVAPIPETPALREEALARRPDLKALADHLAADQAALCLAKKEYYPDFEVMAAYDDFWGERPLRPQLAVRINLPTRLAKRDAAVAEAQEQHQPAVGGAGPPDRSGEPPGAGGGRPGAGERPRRSAVQRQDFARRPGEHRRRAGRPT